MSSRPHAERSPTTWRNRNVWACAGSAFFADLGYQAILAGLPLYIVDRLHGTTTEFALASALGYGIGSLAGYAGGRLGDRYGYKRVAIIGNVGILLLSLIGLARVPWVVILLFVIGWCARNFRSPPRRALLAASVEEGQHGRAFGFLHALDVGGGMLAALGMVGLLAAGEGFAAIFLLTLIPITASTVVLSRAREPGRRMPQPAPAPSAGGMEAGPQPRQRLQPIVKAMLVSTAMYGFSSYSMGFPILTVAHNSRSLVQGVGSYAVFLGLSALTGYAIGGRRWRIVPSLVLGGYGLSALATLSLGLLASRHLGALPLDLAVGGIGVALGFVETAEPTLISTVVPEAARGRAMGSLTAARSLGLLAGNLVMGLLYLISPLAAYSYAAALALLAAFVLAGAGAKARLRATLSSND